MITIDVKCINCTRPFKIDVLEPPEPRYARCPDCGAPHYFAFKSSEILMPKVGREFLGLKS